MWVEVQEIKKRELEFAKKCEAGKLHRELAAAGFDLWGVNTTEDKTIVHLKETETKDPAPVVEAHIYEEPRAPRPIDPEKLKKVLKARGIIKEYSEVEAQPPG